MIIGSAYEGNKNENSFRVYLQSMMLRDIFEYFCKDCSLLFSQMYNMLFSIILDFTNWDFHQVELYLLNLYYL